MAADLGPRVLIADGDPASRQRLFARLLDLDVFSDCVDAGQDALQKLQEITYTVVVLDLGLPGTDAMQVLERIAHMPARPVLLVTAVGEAARTLDAEIVQMVVRRPLDFELVADLVRHCVRTVAARRSVVLPLESAGPDGVRA